MLASRKRPSPLLFAFTLVVFVLIYHSSNNADRIYQQWSTSYESRPTKLPANSTLGFGAVVAVSREDSERRHSLIQAANVTEFDLTIPQQPDWTEGDLETFIDGQSNAQRGSTLAWLGHRNALQWFLDSGLETALILEDDVDWDIRLRSTQVPLAASAFRRLLPPQRSFHPITRFGNHHTQYWGDHGAWDLLYLGHCGDYFVSIDYDGPRYTQDYNMTDMPHMVYGDPTLPAPRDMHPFTQMFFDKLHMPPYSRVFHRSKFPLCSFGYAVTRPAAEKLLNDLAGPTLKEHGPRAFDIALLESCRKGADTPSESTKSSSHRTSEARDESASPGLRCWTLNSELFHHMPGKSMIDAIAAESGQHTGIPPVDLAAQAQVAARNETTNIDCGFWNGAFAFDDDDTESLALLRKHVGRKGKCLKEGRVPPKPQSKFKEYEPASPYSKFQDYDPEARSQDTPITTEDAKHETPQKPLD